mgnify:CR=1 FL=1
MKEYYPDIHTILAIKSQEDFHQASLRVFHYQARTNTVYKQFCELLGTTPDKVKTTDQIPFLPVELFKTHKVISGMAKPHIVFSSSGTTGQATSKHFLPDQEVYDHSLNHCFEAIYGPAESYCFLALLPSYLEREGSSLVYMVRQLMKRSGNPDNGFYLYEHQKLAEKIANLATTRQQTILIGVSFALLDFSEKYPISLPDSFVVMETGGMKGRGREMVREELHEILASRFSVPVIHSEYGMTELLSQAYSKGNGLFRSQPWMKILIRDINDPFRFLPPGKTGAINIIDLANIHSCAFIATQDLGRVNHDGTFEVLGRYDNSDVRGCNLMVS